MKFKPLVTLWTVAACLLAGAAHAEDGVTDSEITIGMVNAQTGPASALGVGMHEGAKAVFKDINARGGIHGRKINLLIADDGYEPDSTMEETLKMVQQQKVFALFGFVGTPTTNAVLPIFNEMEVPLVASFTGAMSLRKPVSEQVYNVRASYDDETEALVGRLSAGGARKIAVVYQYDSFGLAVLQGTERALARRGLALAVKASFVRNTTDVQAAVDAMVAAAPDAVIMAGPYTPLAAFVNAARPAGLSATLATVSFVGTYALRDLVGVNGDGILISQVMPLPTRTDLPVVNECRDLVRKHAHAELGFVNLEGCVSAKVLVAALQGAGKNLTRDALRLGLRGLNGLNLGGLSAAITPQSHQMFDKVYLTMLKGGQVVAQAPPANPKTPQSLATR